MRRSPVTGAALVSTGDFCRNSGTPSLRNSLVSPRLCISMCAVQDIRPSDRLGVQMSGVLSPPGGRVPPCPVVFIQLSIRPARRSALLGRDLIYGAAGRHGRRAARPAVTARQAITSLAGARPRPAPAEHAAAVQRGRRALSSGWRATHGALSSRVCAPSRRSDFLSRLRNVLPLRACRAP